jgi:dihydroorotase
MSGFLIKNASLVNEGKIFEADVLIKDSYIEKIDKEIALPSAAYKEINAEGLFLLPGVIDDQVHFREPGLTHKANIASESRAAVAGGVTTFMEMPNTNPQTVTQELLEEKYQIASKTSASNYSFFMGATNDNLDEVRKTDKTKVCGIKVFMGSSTGNMLVDSSEILQKIFSECDNLIAIHSESEAIIRKNLEEYKAKYGEDIPMWAHPEIRSAEACYESTKKAIELALNYNTRLHVLHISTEEELVLFENSLPLKEKKITAEACVHHLWFDKSDYETLGGLIKCNPAIKEARHKKAVFEAVLDNRIDIIATDHAPHTWEEKQNKYNNCPSGLPLVQHSLQMMLEFYHQSKISLARIAEKMAHSPAECFKIKERGYIREGYKADLVLVDLNAKTEVNKSNILYKCGWSPLEGYTFNSKIVSTFVNGKLAYNEGKVVENVRGERLYFKA